MKWILPLVFASAPAFGQTCGHVADNSEALSAIITKLKLAPTPVDAQTLTDELWRIWTTAPDDAAQALLDEGMRLRERYDYLTASDVLNQLVNYCPDYAEGYNQRAFVSFLQQDYAAALVDLDRAIAIVPDHVAALAGKGLTLLGLGRDAEAQDTLKAAVAINPWLSERSLITSPVEQDI